MLLNEKNKTGSQLPVLPQVKIQSPCPMQWADLDGNTSKRFCGQCQKHVHNFSEMDSGAVRNLLNSGKDICAQITKRTDGSIVTKETRVAQRTWFARLGTLAAGVAAMLTLGGCRGSNDDGVGIIEPPGANAVELMGEIEMGDVAVSEPEDDFKNDQGNLLLIGKVVAPQASPKE